MKKLILFMVLFAASISAATFLRYDGKSIFFGNTSLDIHTCINETCYNGFQSIIGDANINASGEPILDSLVSIRVDYQIPFSTNCIIKISSRTPISKIRNETEDSLLFKVENDYFVISVDPTSVSPYKIVADNNSICIMTINNSGSTTFLIESTNGNNPIDYYHARLYETYSIGPEIEINKSEVRVDPNQLRPNIFEISPISFSTPTINPRIVFFNCTNITFYYNNTLGERDINGCLFEGNIVIKHRNELFVPFDFYLGEIKTNETLTDINESPISVIPSESYLGKVSSQNKTILIKIERADDSKRRYLFFIFINLLLLFIIFWKNNKQKKVNIQNISITIIPTIVLSVLTYGDFALAPLSIVVYLLTVIFFLILYWKKNRKCP